MKKTAAMTCLMLAGATATVLGQMNDGVTAGRQQRSILVAQQRGVLSDQKMNQEAKQTIMVLMKQMNETMQKLSDTFENKAGKEGRDLTVLAKMMREMSAQMGEMAKIIEKGNVDPQTLTNMQARMESVNKRIEALQ